MAGSQKTTGAPLTPLSVRALHAYPSAKCPPDIWLRVHTTRFIKQYFGYRSVTMGNNGELLYFGGTLIYHVASAS